NDGNLKLNNIQISDDHGTIDTNNCTTLAPTACCSYTGSYSVASPSTCSFSDQVSVTAGNVLTSDTASSGDGATCSVNPTARISATKSCTNALVTNASTGHLQDKVAFNGQVCTSNSGTNGDVKLTSVQLSDDQGTIDTTDCTGTLARGACCSYSGSYFPTSL